MFVEKMKLCTRVKAPKHTVYTDFATFEVRIRPEVLNWLIENHIYDGELIAEGVGHDPIYVYYFAKEQDAILFSLRWL